MVRDSAWDFPVPGLAFLVEEVCVSYFPIFSSLRNELFLLQPRGMVCLLFRSVSAQQLGHVSLVLPRGETQGGIAAFVLGVHVSSVIEQ